MYKPSAAAPGTYAGKGRPARPPSGGAKRGQAMHYARIQPGGGSFSSRVALLHRELDSKKCEMKFKTKALTPFFKLVTMFPGRPRDRDK